MDRIRWNLWRAADSAAHLLYQPTSLGRPPEQRRWHDRIHLIPRKLVKRVCDGYDLWLGVTPDELNRTALRR